MSGLTVTPDLILGGITAALLLLYLLYVLARPERF